MKTWAFGCAFSATIAIASSAQAFCGFYVGGADAKLFNDATQVVLLRHGQRTVLSMQNDYKGPPERFAMVVPVPVILKKEDVKTLDKSVFERIDQLTAPRLVEYWEQDPCAKRDEADDDTATRSRSTTMAKGAAAAEPSQDLGVTVEAQFAVGEYEIVILSAKDSSGLDTWLKQEKYTIPDNAEPYFRPYVQAGSKFFVAKVDVQKVKSENGRTALSPLRFHYDTQDLALPVRLGLINSSGTQDLIVNVLAKGQRFEPANYPSVTIPTNLDVAEGGREHFGRFYTALFDRTVEKNPKAIVTEYAWDASTCDPCPGPALTSSDLITLGADVVNDSEAKLSNVKVDLQSAPKGVSEMVWKRVSVMLAARARGCHELRRREKPTIEGKLFARIAVDAQGAVTDASVSGSVGDQELNDCVARTFKTIRFTKQDPFTATVPLVFSLVPNVRPSGWTLTRLHARYSKDSLGEDIVFRAASPITGGREVRDARGNLEHGAQKAGINNFQGRYAIRHPWTGKIACTDPKRGIWGGPPGGQLTKPTAAKDLAFAPRDGLPLTALVRSDIPEIDVKAGMGPAPGASVVANPPDQPITPQNDGGDVDAPKSKACGCGVAPKMSGFGALAAGFIALYAARRRRRP